MCVLPDSIGMESDEIFLMKVHLQQQTLHIIKLQEHLISSIPLLLLLLSRFSRVRLCATP